MCFDDDNLVLDFFEEETFVCVDLSRRCDQQKKKSPNNHRSKRNQKVYMKWSTHEHNSGRWSIFVDLFCARKKRNWKPLQQFFLSPSSRRREKNGNLRAVRLVSSCTLRAGKTMVHEQSTFSSSPKSSPLFYIANRFWNCAERSERLKSTYFSFSHPLVLFPFRANTLDIPFIFFIAWDENNENCYALPFDNGGERMLRIWGTVVPSHHPVGRKRRGKGKFNFYTTFFLLQMEIGYWTLELLRCRNERVLLLIQSQLLMLDRKWGFAIKFKMAILKLMDGKLF